MYKTLRAPTPTFHSPARYECILPTSGRRRNQNFHKNLPTMSYSLRRLPKDFTSKPSPCRENKFATPGLPTPPKTPNASCRSTRYTDLQVVGLTLSSLRIILPFNTPYQPSVRSIALRRDLASLYLQQPQTGFP